MHIISRKKLKEAAARHPELQGPLDAWLRIAKKASWRNLVEVQTTFSSAEAAGRWTVFNIKGNHFRLITEINYAGGRIYLRHVLTHADYGRGGWKQ